MYPPLRRQFRIVAERISGRDYLARYIHDVDAAKLGHLV
jgi:hypothetical protein